MNNHLISDRKEAVLCYLSRLQIGERVSGIATPFNVRYGGVKFRFPIDTKLTTMKGETFHGWQCGLVAQWQSGRLITGWSQVRILPSPF